MRTRPHHARKPASAKIAFALSALCALTLAGSLAFFALCHERAAAPAPSPTVPTNHDDEGFPQVDWDYWTRINPDVIGWITVPHTPINYPVVQAPAHDPTYYLTHDVYRRWNYAGCPYLDARCAQSGLMGSANAVVFAHNMGLGDSAMFATFARYTDAEFATGHQFVLVQTPKEKQAYRVQGAACIPGWEMSKRIDFANSDDFESWYRRQLGACTYAAHGSSTIPARVLTLCTCSYTRYGDERTLVYATPQEPR